MKRLVLLLAVIALTGLVAGAVWADKSHKMTAEVVSVDPDAKTITIKGADGKEMTAPVEGKAAETLKEWKAGDKVELTCRDNDQGVHQAVSSIVKAKAPAPAKE